MTLGESIGTDLVAALQSPLGIGVLAGLGAGIAIGLALRQVRAQHDRLQIGLLQERERQLQAQLQAREQALRDLEDDQRELQSAWTAARTRLEERERQQAGQLELMRESRELLGREFERLAARVFEDRSRQWGAASRQTLEDTLAPLRRELDSFQQRVNQVHSEAVRGQGSLETELRKVQELGLEMNASATRLSDALRGDNKVAGCWGEAQLERTLELAGLRAGEHYQAQATLRDGDGRQRVPDFLILLPNGKRLVIDSKLSLADYQRALEAPDDDGRSRALAAHVRAVQRHVDQLAAKDYPGLPGVDSPDFVLMFMPVESAFVEALKQRRELFDYAWGKGVVLVSHTTLIPVLRTVSSLWTLEQSTTAARELSARAGELYHQLSLVAERLLRLGSSLRAAGNHYNEAVRGLTGQQGLYGKVDRFRELSARAHREMPGLEPVHADLEDERLRAVTGDGSGDAEPSGQ